MWQKFKDSFKSSNLRENKKVISLKFRGQEGLLKTLVKIRKMVKLKTAMRFFSSDRFSAFALT
jgi:hypothetical protein